MSTVTRRKPRLGRPPGATGDATRARILVASRACFAERGFAGTTNEAIAARAGVTAAALYGHFSSKAALYVATARRAEAELVPEFRRAAGSAPTARAALRAVMAESARMHAREPSLAAFLSALAVEMKREDAVASAMDEAPSGVLALFTEIVARGVRDGEITRARAPHVVEAFLACAMGLSLFAATFGGDFDRTMAAFLALVDGDLFKRARRNRSTRAHPPRRAIAHS
jgi:AcrR family transcriptional regulator